MYLEYCEKYKLSFYLKVSYTVIIFVDEYFIPVKMYHDIVTVQFGSVASSVLVS
jgi:hypothetical protein